MRKLKQVRGGMVKPAMLRLKELPQEQREAVMKILEDHTYDASVPLVEQLLGIACSKFVLCRFRRWHTDSIEIEKGQERFQHAAELIGNELPGLKGERLRELGAVFYSFKAMGREDAKEFVRLSEMAIRNERQQCRAWKMDLDERKFAATQQSKLELALENLAEVCREDPAAWGHFQKVKEALTTKEFKVLSSKFNVGSVENNTTYETDTTNTTDAKG